MFAQDPIVKITETVPPVVDHWVNAMQTDDVTFSCQVENLPVGLKVCIPNLFELLTVVQYYYAMRNIKYIDESITVHVSLHSDMLHVFFIDNIMTIQICLLMFSNGLNASFGAC